MEGYVDVYLAEYGCLGEQISTFLLDLMFATEPNRV
jgi:hypothetical protein